ncbi:hypothetical protein NUW54_g10932 [Trametes sanguinea]|uniref:Uncharacterized protein n=1 Tax=Trametes sanguinea TaxID=158606 RepID=A0ACC1NPI8_9APHY|nr:hypothetical protein NUW54_g10932 [Trametes sanguinea]
MIRTLTTSRRISVLSLTSSILIPSLPVYSYFMAFYDLYSCIPYAAACVHSFAIFNSRCTLLSLPIYLQRSLAWILLCSTARLKPSTLPRSEKSTHSRSRLQLPLGYSSNPLLALAPLASPATQLLSTKVRAEHPPGDALSLPTAASELAKCSITSSQAGEWTRSLGTPRARARRATMPDGRGGRQRVAQCRDPTFSRSKGRVYEIKPRVHGSVEPRVVTRAPSSQVCRTRTTTPRQHAGQQTRARELAREPPAVGGVGAKPYQRRSRVRAAGNGDGVGRGQGVDVGAGVSAARACAWAKSRGANIRDVRYGVQISMSQLRITYLVDSARSASA